MNLLDETREYLADYEKAELDVIGVEISDGTWATWEDFVSVASFEYDNGYGGHEISLDLKIVGDGWWLERQEYDGAECWSFKTNPELEEFTPISAANLRYS